MNIYVCSPYRGNIQRNRRYASDCAAEIAREGHVPVVPHLLLSLIHIFKSIYDYLTVGGIGSRQAMTTFYRCKYGLIRVNCGCFNGTIDEFEAAVHETHAGNEHEKAYMAAIRMVKEVMIRD